MKADIYKQSMLVNDGNSSFSWITAAPGTVKELMNREIRAGGLQKKRACNYLYGERTRDDEPFSRNGKNAGLREILNGFGKKGDASAAAATKLKTRNVTIPEGNKRDVLIGQDEKFMTFQVHQPRRGRIYIITY